MKKLVKGLLTLLLAIIMAFTFAACTDNEGGDNGGGNNGGNNNGGGEQVQKVALSEVFAKTAANLVKKDSLSIKVKTSDYLIDYDKYATVETELKLKKNTKSYDASGVIETTDYYNDLETGDVVESKIGDSFYYIDGIFFKEQAASGQPQKVYERQYGDSISVVLDALFGATINESALSSVIAEYLTKDIEVSDSGYKFSIDKDFAQGFNSIIAKIKANGDKTIAEFIAAMASTEENVVTAEQVNALIASVLNDEVTISELLDIIDGLMGGKITVQKIVDGIAGVAGFSAADLREKITAIPEIPSIIIPAVGADDTLYSYIVKFVGELPLIEVLRMVDPTIASLDDYLAMVSMIINNEEMSVKSLFDSVIGGLLGGTGEGLFDMVMSIMLIEGNVNFDVEIDKDFNLRKLSAGIKFDLGLSFDGTTPASLIAKDMAVEIEIDYGTVSEIKIPDGAKVLPYILDKNILISELVADTEYRIKVLSTDGYEFAFEEKSKEWSYDTSSNEIVIPAEQVNEILANGLYWTTVDVINSDTGAFSHGLYINFI